MSLRYLLLALFPVCLAIAADEAPKSKAREMLKARIAEDAKKALAKQSTHAPGKASSANAPATAEESPVTTPPASETNSKSTAAKEAPTVLPKVEVKKDRITELDLQLAKQQREIEREKRNINASEVDRALNDAKIARPLAIFGGDSTQFRKGVAAERVELMEAEKDIMEAIGQAKTKEEKAALQKQLDELRAMRRQLDKSLR